MSPAADGLSPVKIVIVSKELRWERLCLEMIKLDTLRDMELTEVTLADKSMRTKKHAKLTVATIAKSEKLSWTSPELSSVLSQAALVHIIDPFDSFGEAAFAVAKRWITDSVYSQQPFPALGVEFG